MLRWKKLDLPFIDYSQRVEPFIASKVMCEQNCVDKDEEILFCSTHDKAARLNTMMKFLEICVSN